jgi:hypothetical protein
MKLSRLFVSAITAPGCIACWSVTGAQGTYKYMPESKGLYAKIIHMDSVLFNAYNNCDMETQAKISGHC